MEPWRTDSPAVTELPTRKTARIGHLTIAVAACLMLLIGISACAQSTLPFEVSNPKNRKWSPAEATRVYTSACDLLARTIRPENPPRLHPKLLLVLGAEHDEYVRDEGVNEVRLKSWNPERFAEAVVLGAVREVLPTDDLRRVAHQSVSLAGATVTASELKGQ
jgi:hypothetical protein